MKRAMWAMGIFTVLFATAGCSGAQQNAATTPAAVAPATTSDMPPPPTVSPDYGKEVPPKDLESHRIAGVKWIQPSDPVATTMSKAKERKFTGSYYVCIDETGNIAGINLVQSTTFPDYDQTIINTIGATWKYSPFLIDGVASRVCTTVTFIYNL